MERFCINRNRAQRFLPSTENGAPEGPLVLVEHGIRGTRICAVNSEARKVGASPGQMLNDARAACPLIQVMQATPETDTDALDRLAGWALRYSPMTAPDLAGEETWEKDYGLLIDTTGCDHLFGGEEALIADIHEQLTKIGFTVSFGLAPTIGAAHAMARYSSGVNIARHVEETATLTNQLPVEALRLTSNRTLLLRRLGLKTIGALRAVPRIALERRFRSKTDAQSVQLRLDQLSGHIREPVIPARPPAPYRITLPCPEPALDITAIEFALADCLARLTHQLEESGKGARAFRLTAFHADGGASAVTVRLSRPSRDIAHITRLFGEKLEQIDPGFGIDAFLLEASDCEAIAANQQSLIRDASKSAPDQNLAVELSGLIDTLSNRLGERNVYRMQQIESHIPERAWRMVSAGNTVCWEEVETQPERPLLRPFRLFDRPEQVSVISEIPDGPPLTFTWRHVPRQITRARGPERIAPEWWRDGAAGIAVRDYYEIEDTQGRRYWIYREGMYGAADKPSPEWFVHGVFG